MDMISDDKTVTFHQFIRLLADDSEVSEESSQKELALANSIKATSLSMESTREDYESKEEKQREYENACCEKLKTSETTPEPEVVENITLNNLQKETSATAVIHEETHIQSISESDGKPLENITMLSYPRKATVLYELLSACLADLPEDSKITTRQRKGYDARHRVALRLISAWFDLKWITVVHSQTCYVLIC